MYICILVDSMIRRHTSTTLARILKYNEWDRFMEASSFSLWREPIHYPDTFKVLMETMFLDNGAFQRGKAQNGHEVCMKEVNREIK